MLEVKCSKSTVRGHWSKIRGSNVKGQSSDVEALCFPFQRGEVRRSMFKLGNERAKIEVKDQRLKVRCQGPMLSLSLPSSLFSI